MHSQSKLLSDNDLQHRPPPRCRFSNSGSYRGLLTCVSHVCLTSFHLGLSHFAFHFLAVPVSGFDVPGCFLGDLDA